MGKKDDGINVLFRKTTGILHLAIIYPAIFLWSTSLASHSYICSFAGPV